VNPQSITDMLAPLRTPGPIGWWPPAPGWWILAALMLLLLVLLLRRLWQYHRRGAPLRRARSELARIQASDDSTGQRAAALFRLQRALAIRLRGRRHCAGLTGRAWFDFLNSIAGDKPLFDPELADLPYRPEVTPRTLQDLIEATEDWLGRLERPR
jgi:hypothetical protein